MAGLGLLPILDGVIVTDAQLERDSVSSDGGSIQVVTTGPELGSSWGGLPQVGDEQECCCCF